jgi:hypothetical protein
MKKLSIYFVFITVFSLSFAFTNNLDDKESKSKSACPYLQSQNNSECPFMKGEINSSSSNYQTEDKSVSECPYLNKMMENKTGCPFINGRSNEKSNNKMIKDNWKETKS